MKEQLDNSLNATAQLIQRKLSMREPLVQVYENVTSTLKPLKESVESKVSLPLPTFTVLKDVSRSIVAKNTSASYYRHTERSFEENDEIVEYDMDEEDFAWLDLVNKQFKAAGLSSVSAETFELLMDRFEKEAHFQNQTTTADGKSTSIDDDAICSICLDGDCDNGNAILFCDVCNMAVHQDCYGVPYIPEGQWLCRRCLQSPSRAVDCCLCPNRGGALKQTDKALWAHVVCAIWIPEVSFSNTVFLEPIEGIERISSARRKLTCYICKKRNVGACIQCSKAHCYLAFHVTCAQLEGLYMRIEPVSDADKKAGGAPLVKKTAFCDYHSPVDSKGKSMVAGENSSDDDDENSEHSQESSCEEHLKKVRKILARKRNRVPTICVPTILPERLEAISANLTASLKNNFLKKLLSYWKLKRQHYNGVPLLRRLQSSQMSRKPLALEEGEKVDEHSLTEQLIAWQTLRQDFERVRLLLELIKKRERIKRDFMETTVSMVDARLNPLATIMKWALGRLHDFDPQRIFAEPVPLDLVPHYLDYIEHPMDFSTMAKKVNDKQYDSLDDFKADVTLICDNCCSFNEPDTIFYKAAVRLREKSTEMFEYIRQMLEVKEFDAETGIFNNESATVPIAQADQIEGSARKRKWWPDEDVETPQRRTRLQALRNPSPEKPPAVDQSDAATATNDEQRGGNTEVDAMHSAKNEISDSAFDLPNSVSTSQAPFAAKPTSVESFRVYRANSAEIGSDVETSDKDDEDEENDDEESSGSDDSASESADENNEEDTESLTRGRSRHGSASSQRQASETKESTPLNALDLVWAKCQGYPWYPAMVIDPKMARSGCMHNGVHVPAPPDNVLTLGKLYDEPVYLVLFFDKKRTWQWLGRPKIELLGVNQSVDKKKLAENKKPKIRRTVRVAYEKALIHLPSNIKTNTDQLKPAGK